MTQTLPSTRPVLIGIAFEDAPVVTADVPGTPEQIKSVHSEQVRRCRLANVWAAVSDDEEF